tara:strand:+ start:621 stop:1988 length:1368 start_codon:yes stop_codon:yes gene_type:complete
MEEKVSSGDQNHPIAKTAVSVDVVDEDVVAASFVLTPRRAVVERGRARDDEDDDDARTRAGCAAGAARAENAAMTARAREWGASETRRRPRGVYPSDNWRWRGRDSQLRTSASLITSRAPSRPRVPATTTSSMTSTATLATTRHAARARARSIRRAPPRAMRAPRRPSRSTVLVRAAPSGERDADGNEDVGAGLKAVWYGAEAMGKMVGAVKSKDESSATSRASASSASAASSAATVDRERAIALLREDYDSSYFVSGVGELAAYAPDCEFSDPFVAFKGVDRFKQNVGNLGGMMRDVDLKITGWEESESDLVTSWRFSCVLDLPWKPKLAAAGGTTHVFDPDTGKVVKHIERWDVEPKKVVKQLLSPSSKIPENRAQVFMFSLSDGDYLGMWLAVTPAVIKFTAPWVGVSLLAKVAGLSAEGTFVGGMDSVAWWLLVAAVVGEGARFFKGIIGS